MITNKQRSITIYTIAASILAIPLLGMYFTEEIKWTGFDFLIAGILLFSSAFFIDFILRNVKRVGAKMLYIVLIFIVLFLIWVELAVGIFGSPFAGS